MEVEWNGNHLCVLLTIVHSTSLIPRLLLSESWVLKNEADVSSVSLLIPRFIPVLIPRLRPRLIPTLCD